MPNQQDVKVAMTLEYPASHRARLRIIAKALDRPVASLIRTIIAEWLASHDDTGAVKT